MIKFLVAVCLWLFSTPSFSQKVLKAGVNFTVEITDPDVVAGVGATFEAKLRKHGGLETGLYYQTYNNFFFLYFLSAYHRVDVAERHLSIPILYKYYSKGINFSVGPTVDFFIGWAQKQVSADVKINSYSLQPSVNLGLMAKLSRVISLSHKTILEPELRFNPFLTTNRGYAGVGIAAKYILH